MIPAQTLYTAWNPFCSADAMKHSAYGASVDGELVRLLDSRRNTREAEYAHLTLRAAVLHPDFPCVGAKAAVHRDQLRTAHYPAFADRAVSAGLARDLFAFAIECAAADHPFASFVATFAGSPSLSEDAFESALWTQLSLLDELDAPYHGWDATVAADPSDPNFAFSFGGSAFFVVGLHPRSARFARRLPFVALAFNPRRQFDRLRARGDFARMQTVIRRADSALQGSINPMLDSPEPISEARQYAGRAVPADWHCPFRRAVR